MVPVKVGTDDIFSDNDEIEQLEQKCEALSSEKENLQRNLKQLEEEIKDLKAKHKDELINVCTLRGFIAYIGGTSNYSGTEREIH